MLHLKRYEITNNLKIRTFKQTQNINITSFTVK